VQQLNIGQAISIGLILASMISIWISYFQMEQHFHGTGEYERITANMIVAGNGNEVHFRIVVEYRKQFGRNKWILLYDGAKMGIVTGFIGYCIAA
jgi:hypothetical protein